MRRAARVDENQTLIVQTFRNLGCSVMFTHMIGRGVPDLVIGKNNCSVLVEIKDGSKCPSARKLTPDEAEFHANWRGTCVIIESTDEATDLANRMVNSGLTTGWP